MGHDTSEQCDIGESTVMLLQITRNILLAGKSKGSVTAPLVFVLVAGGGFEPAASGPRVGNGTRRLCLATIKTIDNPFDGLYIFKNPRTLSHRVFDKSGSIIDMENDTVRERYWAGD